MRDNPNDYARYVYHKRGWAKSWRWEAYFSRQLDGNRFRFRVTLGGEDTRAVQFSIGLLWFGLYLTIHRLLPKRFEIGWYKRGDIQNPLWFEDGHGRDYGFYLHENHLVLKWNSSNMGSGRDSKKWGRSWSCFIDEKILGRRKYIEGEKKHYDGLEIWFPEKIYKLTVDLKVDTWKYSRWPFWPLTRTLARADVKVIDPKGIPVPGKGENSWDCGDDATYGIHGCAGSVHEAVEMLRSSVLRSRRKYGSGEGMYKRPADIKAVTP